jgi:hypothetical protein
MGKLLKIIIDSLSKNIIEIKKYSDTNKTLNYMCSCNVPLPSKKEDVIMLYPCEHMMHLNCYLKLPSYYDKQTNLFYKTCPFCGEKVYRKLSLLDDKLNYQQFADILSMTNYHGLCEMNTTSNFIDSFLDLTSVFVKLPFLKNVNDGKELCKQIFALNNLTLKVSGLEKIKLVKNKVYIANHVAYLEFVILYYLLGTGFLASSIVGQSQLVDQFKKIVPLLTFNRGEKNRKENIVDKMRDFVDKHGSICLFPEGLMKHPDTLTKFRTGCFHVNRPIYSITIKHNDVISDDKINDFLFKLVSKKNINLEIIIQGPYYPPFNDQDMKNVRYDMAKAGNMILSRVSNRDIKDKGRKVEL